MIEIYDSIVEKYISIIQDLPKTYTIQKLTNKIFELNFSVR